MSFATTFFIDEQHRIARRDRDHGFERNRLLGALERGVEVVGRLGRRELSEQRIQLAFEPRRVVAGRSPGPYFSVDLPPDLVEVDGGFFHGRGAFRAIG